MKFSKNILKISAVFACLLCFTLSAEAQKRRIPVKKVTKPASTAVVNNAAETNAEIKAGAEKVSTQIKNLSKFIYVLGGVAQGIQDIDKDIVSAKGKVARNVVDQNTKNKQTVITTIRNLRAGIVALEIEFRTKPALRTYLPQIQGISDMTGIAEDQAMAGQLTESGKTLLLVVEKLADTLVVLP